ncbi:MAG: HAD family hydrolase [Chloroflexota bacterium]
MLRGVLLDVGGTLWPQHPPRVGLDPRLEALQRLLPALEPTRALAVLLEHVRRDTGLEQHPHQLLAEALRSLYSGEPEADPASVRRALCVPAISSLRPYPGTSELLNVLKSRELRCVIVSNVEVRGALEYERDFEDVGIAHLVDAVVTSLEVGFRKPHRAVFEAAIWAAGCAPMECVMVGNSEENDIEPAVALGLRAIRVAIEEPWPQSSAADRMVTNLAAVSELLSCWR